MHDEEWTTFFERLQQPSGADLLDELAEFELIGDSTRESVFSALDRAAVRGTAGAVGKGGCLWSVRASHSASSPSALPRAGAAGVGAAGAGPTLTERCAESRLQLRFNFSHGGPSLSLELPPPVHGQLPRPPLTLVVCQIRFETKAAVGDGRTALRFYEELGGNAGHYDRPEKADVRSLALEVDSQSGAVRTLPTGPALNGWRLRGRDEPWLVSLMPEFVSLETTGPYSSWKGFRSRLTRVLAAAEAVLAPETEQRLGLRYVDQIAEPEVAAPQDWADYIEPSLLGMAMHPKLGAAVTKAQQHFELRPSDDCGCVVRQSFFPDEERPGRQSFVLDTDVFREGARLFDSAEALSAADAFHTFALQVFQQSITGKLFDLLRGANAAAR